MPVRHAVVMVETKSPKAPEPVSFDWPAEMVQENIQFVPYVLIASVGSDVTFPNHDRVRHHVYSFSKGNRFELRLYGREEKRFITFEAPGIVAVGCNIHDGMVGYIRVVDTPFAGKTDENGVVDLGEVPEDLTTVTVWHPDQKPSKDYVLVRPGDGSTLAARIELKAAIDPAHH